MIRTPAVACLMSLAAGAVATSADARTIFETATFTGEPPRSSLTEPPPGYQTPSSAAPYAAGDERNGWKIPTLFDRPVGRD